MKHFFKKSNYSKLVVLFVLVIISACNSSEKVDETTNGKENNLFISGVISGAEGQGVFLEAASQNGVISVAETKIAGEKFELATTIPGLGIYQLRLGDKPENALVLTANSGDKIKIEGDINTIALNAKISGVDWAKQYNEFMQLAANFSNAQNELMGMQGKVTQN